MYSVYCKPWLELTDPANDKVHSTYSVCCNPWLEPTDPADGKVHSTYSVYCKPWLDLTPAPRSSFALIEFSVLFVFTVFIYTLFSSSYISYSHFNRKFTFILNNPKLSWVCWVLSPCVLLTLSVQCMLIYAWLTGDTIQEGGRAGTGRLR